MPYLALLLGGVPGGPKTSADHNHRTADDPGHGFTPGIYPAEQNELHLDEVEDHRAEAEEEK